MSRRQQQKAATRQRLLDAARASFETLGFERTTLSSVARQAGVAVGTVCLHFPTKADLVAASFFDHLEALIETGRPTESLPLQAALASRFRPLFAFYLSNPARSRALLQHTLFLSGEWGQRFAQQALSFVGELQQHLDAAVTAGHLQRSLDTGLAARGIFGDYFQVLMAMLHAWESAPPDVEEACVLALAQLDAAIAQRLHGYTREIP